MSSKVRGENVIVYIYDDGQWKPYACGTTCTLDVITDFIESSVKGNGKFANFVPTKNSFTGTIDGLVNFGLANTLSLQDLRQRQLAHVKMLMRFERTDTTGSNTYVDEAYFFISNSSDTGPMDGMNSFSISLRGTGALTQTFVPTIIDPNGKVKSIYINSSAMPAPGAITYTPAAGILIGKDIVGAWRGTDVMPITTGTPGTNEIKYTSASGTFDWIIPLETDPIPEIIHIQYQDI